MNDLQTCRNPLTETALIAFVLLSFPNTHATGQQSELFVSSSVADSVQRYDGSTGAFIDTFAFGGGLNQPRDLVFSPHDNNLYVASELTNEIKRYDGITGAFIDTFASMNLDHPVGMAFGPDGNLYVASFSGSAVRRFNGVTGGFIDTFASGSGLNGAYDLTFGPDGDLYVISGFSNQIKHFDGATGAFVGDFVSGLNSPADLTFGPDSNFYVMNRGSNQVKRFNGSTGAFIDDFASGPWQNEAISLDFGPDDNLYISINNDISTLNGRIERFNGTTGAFMDTFVPSGSGGLQGAVEFAFRQANPDSFHWTGAAGDMNFANLANWSPAGVPGILDTATINGPAMIVGSGRPAVLNVTHQMTTTGLTLTNSAINNSGLISANGSNAFLRLINSSVINANGTIQASGSGAALQLQVGTNLIGGTLSSTDNSAIEVNGANVSADLVETASGGRIDLNSGLLRTTTLITNAIGTGDFDHEGGRLEVLNFDGNFEQVGGTYAPGLPTGVSNLTGAYILRTGGTLEIEVGGDNLGAFDQLFVGGLALEGGQLSVVSMNGFQAAAGDSFGIISVTGNRTGFFPELGEGDLVGDFGEDLYITYKAGDGNDIGLYNPLVLGSVNFADAGPDDDAFFVGDRAGSGGIPAPPETITLESLTLLNGSSFTLDPNETLELNGGTLFIGQGAVFSGNGIIRGNVINAGLLRIPIVRVPTIAQTAGGHIEIELPEPPMVGGAIIIDLPDGGFGAAVDTIVSFDFDFEGDVPPPVVVQGDPAPNEGIIRFDASLEITGSYEQRETGALRLFIAGDDLPGENYSQLIVGEVVTLAGSLEIVFDPTLFSVFDYVPMVGDTFDLIVSEVGIAITDSGLNLLNFVTADGASLVGGVTLSPYDSGIAADPDSLLMISETLFRIDLVENNTILRATLVKPISFVPEPSAGALQVITCALVTLWRRGISGLASRHCI